MSRDIAIVNVWDSAETINSTATITSDGFSQHKSLGTCALLVILAGTTPSVDINFQVARTPTDTFYSPVDTDGNSLATIGSSITTTTWIQFSPGLAPSIRFRITGTGSNGVDTTARAYLVYQEEF